MVYFFSKFASRYTIFAFLMFWYNRTGSGSALARRQQGKGPSAFGLAVSEGILLDHDTAGAVISDLELCQIAVLRNDH